MKIILIILLSLTTVGMVHSQPSQFQKIDIKYHSTFGEVEIYSIDYDDQKVIIIDDLTGTIVKVKNISKGRMQGLLEISEKFNLEGYELSDSRGMDGAMIYFTFYFSTQEKKAKYWFTFAPEELKELYEFVSRYDK